MTSWKEERDQLVAQTLAFVQQVTAAHPAVADRIVVAPRSADVPAPNKSATFNAAIGSQSPSASADAPVPPSEFSERGPQPATVNSTAAIVAAGSRPHALYSVASEREDILRRVAAFKARQGQMSKDREAYYDTMQARIRTTLGNESSRDRL